MGKLRRYFFTGLAVSLPLVLTGYIVFFIFKFLDNLVGKFINVFLKNTFGFYIPGLGIILFIGIILIIGFLITHLLGRGFISFLEKIILKFPILKGIYPASKKIVNFLLSSKQSSFKRVVMIEYPRKGVYSIGFVTNEAMSETKEKLKKRLLNVFIPSSPGPFTGYFILVPAEEVIFLDISVEKALKLIVSGGIIQS